MTDTTNEFEAEYALHPDAHLREKNAADTAGASPLKHHHGGQLKRTFRRTERRSLIRQSVRGAVSSLIASTVMGGLLGAARKLGLLGEDPPTKLTRKALETIDVHPRHEKDLAIPTVAMHLGYGAAIGAVSGPLLERIPNRTLRVLGGVATGAAVWAVSYGGWIPAVGWMPQPQNDAPPTRPWVMFGAHLLFGAVLGASLPSAELVHELDLNDDPHVEAIGLS
ncbi:MAG: hypothetical protein ACO1OB_26375 [Archangium sp.]